MKGDLILHLDPQPLPALSEASQDDELELSQEPEPVCELSPKLANEIENNEPSGTKNSKTMFVFTKTAACNRSVCQ